MYLLPPIQRDYRTTFKVVRDLLVKVCDSWIVSWDAPEINLFEKVNQVDVLSGKRNEAQKAMECGGQLSSASSAVVKELTA